MTTDSEDFRRFRDTHLEPLRGGLEARRRISLRRIALRIALSLLVLGIIVAGMLWVRGSGDEGFWWVFGTVVVLTCFGFGVWCYLPWGLHRMRLKSEVLTRLVPFFGDFVYRLDPKWDLKALAASHCLPRFNKDFLEDEVSGVHAGICFRACEARLEYEYTRRSGSGSNRTTVTERDEVFDGLMVEVELPEAVRGTVLFGHASAFEGPRRQVPAEAGLHPVEVGQPDFRAWGSDPVAARWLLDPEFLARAAALSSRFGVRELRMTWHGERLLLLLDYGEDLFELPQRGELDFDRVGETVGGQLGRLTGTLELLGIEPIPEHQRPSQRSLAERVAAGTLFAADMERKEDRGCLPTLALFTLSFCVFLWLLAGQVAPTGVLGLALVFGGAVGVGLANLMFSGRRVLGIVMLLFGLLGLAPALPAERLETLPLGEWVQSLKLEDARR
jgi:hypothetical protein